MTDTAAAAQPYSIAHARRSGRRFAALAALGILLALLTGALGALGAKPAHANVENFSYDSWHVDYRLGVDADGRATAQVTETIEPRFPDFDQNRGIVLGKPVDYQGSSTDPSDFTVTDAEGNDVPFELERREGFIVVLVGDDSYVHGLQHYVISYTLRDVVLARDDGTADEFYWDLLDSEHPQTIDSFSASIAFDEPLAAKLTGAVTCYGGIAGSTGTCETSGTGTADDPVTIPSSEVGAYQGVTIAIGLEPGSVAQPGARLPNFALDVVPAIVGGGAAALGIGGAIVAMVDVTRRRKHRGTIIAQYDVPAYLPPLIAGPIAGAGGNSAAAEIIHLAVTGALRIEEGEETRGFFGMKEGRPVLRLLDRDRAGDPLDAQMLHTLFANSPRLAPFTLPKSDQKFSSKMSGMQSAGTNAAQERGYFEKVRSPRARLLGFLALGVGLLAIVLGILSIVLRHGEGAMLALPLGIISIMAGFVSISRHRAHTPAGAETREYLLGVKLFISVAEAERLKMLQSYSGAERRVDSSGGADGQADVIHLYEKLLPYAVLFGLEKEWSRTLEVKYEEMPGYTPVWYPAAAGAGLANFSSTVNDFTSTLRSSVSYTSSSSGGSSGGGSVGGGGGGGFSGGR